MIRIYGAAGHGKELIDDMSAFGVKNILRKAIVREDAFWKDSKEICHYLSDFIKHDGRFVYRRLPKDTLVKHRLEHARELETLRFLGAPRCT